MPAIVLKKCSPELTPILSKLLRHVISKSEYPNSWSTANIHPTPKKGNRSDPTSYRPIVLTSILSKVLKTLLNNHIISHHDNFQILQDTQYRFRKQRSTIDPPISLTNKTHQSVDHHGESFALALDISKAFDRVWHAGLFSKLPIYGLSVLCPLLSSFLSNIKIRVLLDGCT